MEWYVIFVETGKESLVQNWLRIVLDSNQYSSMVPKKIISERRNGIVKRKEKIIFPGYVFINIQMSFENYYKISNIPRFNRILRNQYIFLCISYHEMKTILRLINNDCIVDYSKVYINNSKVYIIDGPLKGMEGLVKKIDKRKERATIELKLFNEKRFINVGIEYIERV